VERDDIRMLAREWDRRGFSRRAFLRLLRSGAGATTIAGILGAGGGAAAWFARETAAAPSAKAAAPPRGGAFVAAGTGEIKMDPYYQTAPTWIIQGQIYGALFDYLGPDPFKIHGQIAESWQESDKELTVKLRPGVKFHTGREVTAQDVADNIDRALDKSIGHYLYDYFNPAVAGREVIDKYTVKIAYKTTYPLKLDDLTILYLIPKEAMADVATKPVGSGPFKFVSYSPGDTLEMERFDQYWEQGRPYLDKVTIKFIPDAQARIANLQAGSLDFVDSLAPSDIVRLQKEGKYQVAAAPPGGFWYCNVMNCAKPPLDNKLVRQALNYSMDREKVAKLAYFNRAPATQSRYLPSSPWYSKPAATRYTFDLTKAKALLQQAGHPDGFTTTLSIGDATIPGSKAMAQIWSQDLATIGVKLTILEKEQGPFFDDYFKGNYEIIGWLLGDGKADPASGINNSSPLRTENNKANIQTQPFFADYRKLVDQGVGSIDLKLRKPIYDKIQQYWADEGWSITIAFAVFADVLSGRTKGFRPSIDQVPHFGLVWF
jgi:peptide/nickel transport system substrate-binding protein